MRIDAEGNKDWMLKERKWTPPPHLLSGECTGRCRPVGREGTVSGRAPSLTAPVFDEFAFLRVVKGDYGWLGVVRGG